MHCDQVIPIKNKNFSWLNFRENFTLDSDVIHLSLCTLTPHSKSLNNEISKFRILLDQNPDLQRKERVKYMDEVLESAASYMGTRKDLIAITDSTTMGLAIVYLGLRLNSSDEILTTNCEHYCADKLFDYLEARFNTIINRISLYQDPFFITEDIIISRILSNITENTRILALTWVNSCFGIKLPLSKISSEIKKINLSRPENKKLLICIDGVHGFGIENFDSIENLGIDFFSAGCHKWLFGPRGTGILWGSERGWNSIEPIIPSFEAEAWKDYLPWEPKPSNFNYIKSKMCTPGGFKSFEHVWALKHAFDQHAHLGKEQVQNRIQELNLLAKNLLVKIPNLELLTPMDSNLSAGLVSFNTQNIPVSELIAKMLHHNIVIGQAPYKTICARIAPGICNTEEEIIKTCRLIETIANE